MKRVSEQSRMVYGLTTATMIWLFPNMCRERAGRAWCKSSATSTPGLYRDGRPSPGTVPFDIASGESTIREQYLAAIDAARRSIYIENQALSVGIILDCLKQAIERGVETVLLLPAEPEHWVAAARQKPENKSFFDTLASLDQYENFTLVGIAGLDTAGVRRSVYVHAKLMLIDDAWATVGSCNLHRNSLYGHSELNASFWDPEIVRALRCELLTEHLSRDTANLDDRDALRLYRNVACANRAKRDAGISQWQGLAFKMNPASYGSRPCGPKPIK